ncbi:beta-galactosidase [Auriculariales sp. MPI-PUGE-AT-0066]|nr:beta-galactosidase [Auriculariales sp. MPI-PUGE-AT-0066]
MRSPPSLTMKSLPCQLACLIASAAVAAAERFKYNFNPSWKLHVGEVTGGEAVDLDDSEWSNITLPHAWNEDDAFHVDISSLSTGIAWYRKHFKIPSTDAKVFLEFEGIRHGGDFYLNGDFIGRSENGVMAFGFDVSNVVINGQDNIIAARIDNAWNYHEVATGSTYQWSDKNFYANYGGINKNAYLHATSKLYQTLPLYSNLNTTGVYVFASDIDIAAKTATVTVEAEVRNEFDTSQDLELQVKVSDLDGKHVSSFQETFSVAAGETQVLKTSSALSDLHFWSWGYGYLYTIETSLVVDGNAVDIVKTVTGFRKTSFESGEFTLNNRVLQVKGYAQRTTNEWPALGSAVPAWLSDLSNGLVLESNGNLIRWMHVTPWKQDVESLDRLGILQAMPAGDSEGDVTGRRWEQRVELMRDAIIYNRNNPSVVFYESGNHGISEDHMAEMIAVRDLYDPHGGRAIGSREMLNSTVAEYGGEMLYINKCARIPLWQMEYSRDEGLRKWWDEYSPPYHVEGSGDGEGESYNHNQDAMAIENAVRWNEYFQQRPGTGTRVNAGGVNIIFADSNTHHRGNENYRRSGEVDALRLPKDGWYAHKVMWDNWVDLEKTAVHIVGHWNYNDTTVKNVTAISTAERVELFLNGKSLGDGLQSNRFIFTFPDVAWESGTLEARGYVGGATEAAASYKQTTSGAPAAIRLSPSTAPHGFRADGADIALVTVEVVDSAGNRVPVALDLIKFELTGDAEWRGGIAQGEDNYILATNLPVENGVNRVMLRSTTTAGIVHLTAAADGLTSASLTLNTKACKITDGLSTEFPSDGLTSNLSRGPTPSGPSYTVSRKALQVASVTSGSNNDTLTFSYDDNEYATWTSSSTTANAWATYQLAEVSLVDTVVVKMGKFKDTHGLNITVDNTTVWSGRTPDSLGYATLQFEPTTGSSVTLRSTSGALAINEVELYTSV